MFLISNVKISCVFMCVTFRIHRAATVYLRPWLAKKEKEKETKKKMIFQ